MSWLGGSISSITGQLSNLTKDILTEGTEEITDHVTELQLAEEKIKSADILNNAIKQENERLKRLTRELEEKCESAELQINNISTEYRILLEEKEKENKELKHKHHELLDLHAKSAWSNSSPSGNLTHSISTPFLSSRNHTGGLNEDDLDIGDTISLQHEVNQLRQEVQRLQTACQHWRSVAEQTSADQGNVDQTNHGENLQLQSRIQELENQLIKEKEHHQHEVISLQDVHHDKLSSVKKSHKRDVAKLEEKFVQLQETAVVSTQNTEANSSDLKPLQQENESMKRNIDSLNKELEKIKIDNEVSLSALEKSQSIIKGLEEEKKTSEVEMVQLRKVEEEAAKIQVLSPLALDETVPPSDTADYELMKEENMKLLDQVKSLQKTNNKYVVEKDLYEQRLKSYRRQLAELQDGDAYDDGFESDLTPEKVCTSTVDISMPLDEQVESLQKQVHQYQNDIDQFEFLKSDWQLEKEALEDVLMQLREQLKQTESSLTVAEAHQGLQEVARHGTAPSSDKEDTTELDEDSANELANQIDELVSGNQHLEEERDALLEKVDLLEDRVLLLEKETDTLSTSLNEHLTIVDDSGKMIKEKQSRLHTLQQEKEDLETSLDQLDLQHQEEQTQLINIKNELAKKSEKLTAQLKEKESVIADLRENLQSQADSQNSEIDSELKLSQLEENIERLSNELNIANMKNKGLVGDLEDIKTKLQNGAVAVNDLHMDIRELEASLTKSNEELSNKTAKIKTLKEEMKQMTVDNQNLTDKVEDLEEEVDKWESINEINQVRQKSETDDTKLQSDYIHLKKRLDEAEVKVSVAETINAESENKIKELTNEIDSLLQETDTPITRQVETETQCQAQLPLHSSPTSDIETKLDVMSSEKQRLEKELDILEQKYSSQAKHYEKYIKELGESRNMDQNTLQQEHQRLAHIVHQKENIVSELHSQLEDMRCEWENTKETTKTAVNSQQQIAVILQETEDKLTMFRNKVSELEKECEDKQQKLQIQETSLQSMQELQEEVQKYNQLTKTLKCELEETKKLAQQNSEAMDEKHKTLAVITELETELITATNKLVKLDETKRAQETLISDHEKGISLLNKKMEESRHELETEKAKVEHQENIIAILRQNSTQKEDNLDKINRKLKRATSFLNDDQKAAIEMDNNPDFTLPALEYHSPINTTDINGFDERDLDTEQIESVNIELNKLQGIIGQKDQIITELQHKNSSLIKVLETKSLRYQNNDTSIVDVQRLENEVKKLVIEKEQIMAIMNEKSRESSNLKTEVLRLMNVVSAEKSALNKLQKDNHELNQVRDRPNEDMQKAALQQLSRIIRDKDVEIEALKQKNETLLAVLQDNSTENSNNQLSNVLQEKETLSLQFTALQGQNEQMLIFLNQKHQESVTYHNEVQRLSVIIAEESQKSETIKAEYTNIVPQFEEKTKALLILQDEIIAYKQKFSELEIKYGEMLQRSNVKDTVDVTSFNAKEEELKRIQDKFLELQKSVHDKDQKLHSLSQQRGELENEVVGKEADRHSLKKHVEHLQFQIQGLNSELGDLRSENVKLSQNQSQYNSEFSTLKDMNNNLTSSLREKELEMSSMKEKCDTLNNLLQDQRKGEGQQVHQGQVDRLVKQTDMLRQQTIILQQERDQALTVLQQRQEDRNQLVKEVERLHEKEIKMTRELDRLRAHLIQIEEGYTREALDSEQREKELRNRVAIAEEQLMSASTNVETASHQLTLQIEELRYQLQVVSSQRDAAYSQVTGMQDQCQQYASSLANLQIVLEQFQQDKDSQIACESERYEEELEILQKQYTSVKTTLDVTKNQLDEASEGLEAAARLSQQLDRKEEAVQALRDEVQLREKSLKVAEEEIRKLSTSTEAKVDKELMKNLLLGYFTTPQKKRKEVVHTIGGVLNFNPEEFNKISEAESGGWVPGLFKLSRSTGPTPPTTPVRTGTKAPSLNQSFSQLFVKFLERESSPPPPTVRLPAEQMVKELQQKHKEKESSKPPAFNPFTAPRHVAMPINLDSNNSTRSDTHILMASTNTPSFTPMFTTPVSNDNISQPNSGRSTPQNSSSAILKDVLGTR